MKHITRILAAALAIMMLLGVIPACAESAPTPTYGGTLTFGNPISVNSFWANSTTFPGTYAMTWPCVEPLGFESNNGNYEFLLVDEAIRDNEKLTLTLKIHPGVKFHDGSELTAEVVAWNIQTCIDKGIARSVGNPVSVKALDDLTVEVQYDEFSLMWEKLICKVYMYSKAHYDANGEDGMHTTPVGTGPFFLAKHEIDKIIRFERFEDYWGGRPYLDAIEYVYITDATAQVSAFINGQIGEIESGDRNTIEAVEKAGYTEMTPFQYGGVSYIMFNSTLADSPWGNPDVRRAVCLYGVDWDGIAYALQGEYAKHYYTSATPESNHWLDEKEWNLDWGYDRDRALKMLADAGYPNGFETSLYCGNGDSRAATMIQAALADLGIKVNVEFVANTADWRDSGNIEGMIIGGEFSYLDWSSRVTDYYSETGLYQKVMGFSDNYKETYKKFMNAATTEESTQLLKQLNYILHYEDCYMMPFCFMRNRFYSQSVYHGWDDAKRYPASWSANKLWMEQ